MVADFSGAGKHGVVLEGGSTLVGSVKTNDSGGSGMVVKNGSSAFLHNSESNNNQDAGYRIDEGNFILSDTEAKGNRIGLDLQEDARGDVIDSEFLGNTDVDIRYKNDVLVGVYDTAAKELQNLAWGFSPLDRVDAQWITSRILDTTDAAAKAQWFMRWIKRFGRSLLTGSLLNLILMGLP